MEVNQASEMPVYEMEVVFRLVLHYPQGDVHKRWHRMMKKQNLRQGTRRGELPNENHGCHPNPFLSAPQPTHISHTTYSRYYTLYTHVPKNPGGIPLEVGVVDDAGPSNIGLICDRRGLSSPKRKRKRKKKKKKKEEAGVKRFLGFIGSTMSNRRQGPFPLMQSCIFDKETKYQKR